MVTFCAKMVQVFNIGIGILAGVFIGFGLYYTVDVDQNVVAMLAILLVPLLFISVFGVIVYVIVCRILNLAFTVLLVRQH